MEPKQVQSALAIGVNNWEYTLFQIAISLAENGLHVWLISPKIFDAAPPNIKTPDKEILQLITVMYLKDHTDLITQLNSIQLWRKLPNVIMVMNYEHYCGFNESYSPLQAALMTTTLLDNAAVCAVKNKNEVKLLVTCSQLSDSNLEKLQVLKDLYFNVCMCTSEDSFLQKTREFFGQDVL